MCLIASGGHTLLARVDEHDGFEVLGRTLDDAAGEAFDKGARMLGLGYPGRRGARAARRGRRPRGLRVPRLAGRARARRARRRRGQRFADGLDFSFAGLKTALLYTLRELSARTRRARARRDLAASYQAAIVESLVERAERALERTGHRAPGGRRRRGRQRRAAPAPAASWASTLHVPARALCTDNAAMIASAARFASGSPTRATWRSTPTPAASAAYAGRDADRCVAMLARSQ